MYRFTRFDIDHGNRIRRAAFHGQGDVLAVRAPGEPRRQDPQALEFGAGLPIDQFLDTGAIAGIGDEHIEQPVARRYKRDAVPQRR